MKNQLYSKLAALSLASSSLIILGCATPQQGGGAALSTIDSGLASIEQSAQMGRQAITTGSEMANTAGQISLTDILVQQLGITQQQAMGGTGAIFQLAQTGMTPQAFATLSQSVPGMTEMLNAAPVVSNPLMGMGSGVSTLLGNTGAGATLNNAAILAASFQQLNLSPDMIGQFVPIVSNYVRTTSGQLTADLLNSALDLQ